MTTANLHMKYFVLKPAGTDAYAVASRRAMLAYAKWIGGVGETDFAKELTDWVDRETLAAKMEL